MKATDYRERRTVHPVQINWSHRDWSDACLTNEQMRRPQVGDLRRATRSVTHTATCSCGKIDTHIEDKTEVRVLVRLTAVNECSACKGEGFIGGPSGSDGYSDTCYSCRGLGFWAEWEEVEGSANLNVRFLIPEPQNARTAQQVKHPYPDCPGSGCDNCLPEYESDSAKREGE